jgi:hypothetical protein
VRGSSRLARGNRPTINWQGVGSRGVFRHPGAKLRRQGAGEGGAQPPVIQENHRQACLAKDQPPAMVEQVLREGGAVGQGLAQGDIEGEGIAQGRIVQLHHHPGTPAGGGALGLVTRVVRRHLAEQHGAPTLEQPRQLLDGIQGLAVPLPLEQRGVHPGPTRPCGARGGQPASPGFGQGPQQGQEIPQGHLLMGLDGHQLVGVPGLAEHPPAETPMNSEEGLLRRRTGTP